MRPILFALLAAALWLGPLPAQAEQKAAASGCANGVCALPDETAASGADETFEQIERQFKSGGKAAQGGRGMMNPAMMANCPCMKMMAMMMKMPGMQMPGMQMPGMPSNGAPADGTDHSQHKN